MQSRPGQAATSKGTACEPDAAATERTQLPAQEVIRFAAEPTRLGRCGGPTSQRPAHQPGPGSRGLPPSPRVALQAQDGPTGEEQPWTDPQIDPIRPRTVRETTAEAIATGSVDWLLSCSRLLPFAANRLGATLRMEGGTDQVGLRNRPLPTVR